MGELTGMPCFVYAQFGVGRPKGLRPSGKKSLESWSLHVGCLPWKSAIKQVYFLSAHWSIPSSSSITLLVLISRHSLFLSLSLYIFPLLVAAHDKDEIQFASLPLSVSLSLSPFHLQLSLVPSTRFIALSAPPCYLLLTCGKATSGYRGLICVEAAY